MNSQTSACPPRRWLRSWQMNYVLAEIDDGSGHCVTHNECNWEIRFCIKDDASVEPA